MNNDKDLFRQALQRQNERAARIKMPDDMEQRVMQHIQPKKAIRLWPYSVVAAVAACILLLLIFRFSQETVEEQPVVAETIEPNNQQPAPQPIVEEKKEEALPEVKPTPQPAKKHRKAVIKPEAPAEPTLAQAEAVIPTVSVPEEFEPKGNEPLIPAHKQALVNIFLAEEALQVAYELQAQQEAIRAYAARLTGEEPAKPIIAF